jgi:curved DNA-binding protein CbpA
MKWFNDCQSIDEVKAAYKKLAKQYHPDLGGDTLTMQEINKEYAFASARAVKGAKLSQEESEKEMQFSESYREAIEKIIHLEGIVIEVVGYWIWVTGILTRTGWFLKKRNSFLLEKNRLGISERLNLRFPKEARNRWMRSGRSMALRSSKRINVKELLNQH